MRAIRVKYSLAPHNKLRKWLAHSYLFYLLTPGIFHLSVHRKQVMLTLLLLQIFTPIQYHWGQR